MRDARVGKGENHSRNRMPAAPTVVIPVLGLDPRINPGTQKSSPAARSSSRTTRMFLDRLATHMLAFEGDGPQNGRGGRGGAWVKEKPRRVVRG